MIPKALLDRKTACFLFLSVSGSDWTLQVTREFLPPSRPHPCFIWFYWLFSAHFSLTMVPLVQFGLVCLCLFRSFSLVWLDPVRSDPVQCGRVSVLQLLLWRRGEALVNFDPMSRLSKSAYQRTGSLAADSPSDLSDLPSSWSSQSISVGTNEFNRVRVDI